MVCIEQDLFVVMCFADVLVVTIKLCWCIAYLSVSPIVISIYIMQRIFSKVNDIKKVSLHSFFQEILTLLGVDKVFIKISAFEYSLPISSRFSTAGNGISIFSNILYAYLIDCRLSQMDHSFLMKLVVLIHNLQTQPPAMHPSSWNQAVPLF